MLVLIAALLAAAVMSPWLLLRAGKRAFLALALVPLAGTAWVAAQGAAVHDGEILVEVHPWVGSIGLDLAFAMGALQWVMALIVAGVGALVLVYCAWYFDDDEPRRRRASPASSSPSPARCSGWSWPTTCCCSTSSGS